MTHFLKKLGWGIRRGLHWIIKKIYCLSGLVFYVSFIFLVLDIIEMKNGAAFGQTKYFSYLLPFYIFHLCICFALAALHPFDSEYLFGAKYSIKAHLGLFIRIIF